MATTNGDTNKDMWKPYLYQLQQNAPKPHKVRRKKNLENCPPYYGDECHGVIKRDEADRLVSGGDGCYLVRESERAPGFYSLSMRFGGETKHYKLYYDTSTSQHYIADKRFDTLDDLVQDGLICMYIETHASSYIEEMQREVIYEETPYHTIHAGKSKKKRRQAPAVPADGGVRPKPRHRVAPPPPQSPSRSATETSDVVDSTRAPRQPVAPPRPPERQPVAPVAPPVPVRQAPVKPAIEVLPSGDGEANQATLSVSGSIVPPSIETEDEEVTVSEYKKAHDFKVHTFHGMTWCHFCGNFMWGLTQQGVKCNDCGFPFHKKCSERMPPDCHPDVKYVRLMFGTDLTTLVKAHNKPIPAVLDICVKEIERRGLQEEGLYRVSGSADDVDVLREEFDKPGQDDGTKWSGLVARCEDIHTLCSLLKLYLRLLPIPLVTYDTYDLFIHAAKRYNDNGGQLDSMVESLQRLPEAHLHTLRYLVLHLGRVAARAQVNKMSVENLAVVFGPTVLCSSNPDPMARLASSRFENIVMEILVRHHVQLFSGHSRVKTTAC